MIIGIIVFASSCAEDDDPDFEKEAFTCVFDHSDYSAAFYPIDIRQTADGGYLILAERKISGSNFRGTYLLKADAFGNYVRDLTMDDHANPVGDLMAIGRQSTVHSRTLKSELTVDTALPWTVDRGLWTLNNFSDL